MSTQQDNAKIIWVRGNTQQLLIPLEKEVVSPSGDITTVDFYPDEEAVIKVILYNDYRKYEYTPSLDGNLLTITDSGTLAVGCYGVAVTVKNPDGTRYHSNWPHQVVVTATNNSVLQEWDEFKQQDVKARAAIFFFAKGDKGDPFTYEDFTPEQIVALQKPAQDKADEVAELQEQWTEAEQERASAETQRASAEQARNTAENQRIAAEQGRVSAESQRASDTQAAINRANAATSAANTAAQNAKADYVGSDNYVYHWNATTQEYEKTNIYVKGDPGTTDYNELENKPDLTLKADKVIGGVNGHLAGLDANGNIMDSGKQPSDFATASQGAKADAAQDQLAIIAALIPEQASSANQLADKNFVNSSIQTNTAEFKGTRNLVTDLSLTTSATQQQIAAALASAISSADNNDYCFVQIPTDDATPTQIARVDRYKYNGSAWLFEWSLNNSSFTAAQWASINSTITSGDVDKLRLLPTKAQLDALLTAKQDKLVNSVNIKSINYQSLLGSGNLDISDVFIADYGSTSLSEIEAAYSSGKVIVARAQVMRGNGFFILTQVDYEYDPMGAYIFTTLVQDQLMWFSLGSINGYTPISGFGINSEIAAKYTKPSSGIPASDIAAGVIPDVSNFITNSVNNLINYYLKSETYTQSEVNALIGSIQQFHFEIYPSLQDITTPATNVLYLIGPTGSGSDKYEEYVYANSDFQKIGDTSIDLSNYVTTQALNTALANYVTSSALATALVAKPDFVVENEDEQSLINEVDRVLLLLYQALNDAGAVITPAQAATALAQAKAQLADQAATDANEAATLANTKAGYAQDQGDYAKAQGQAAQAIVDDAKGDFDSLDERLDYIEENAGTVDFVEDNTDTFPWRQ